MKQQCNPPSTGLVLEVGSGDNPNPRSDILVDRFLEDNTERGGDLKQDDRPLVVADAHFLPFRQGVFAYAICSHILEHMDDPKQFVDELTRVSKQGYIGCPSEIAERLFHWSFHRWYVNLVDGTLVLYPKESPEPFGELFDYLYEFHPIYYFFQRSMPHLFWVDYVWDSDIYLEVTDHSPLPLKDPDALRDLVKNRLSLPQLVVLFVISFLSRGLRSSTRRMISRLLGRSYM